MRSEDKCDCKWCEQHYGWEQGWIALVLATTVFMAVLMGAGYATLELMAKLVRAIGLLFGIGW